VVGGPLVGWAAEQFGSRWSLIVGGVPTVLLGLAMLPALRRIDRAAATRSAQPVTAHLPQPAPAARPTAPVDRTT